MHKQKSTIILGILFIAALISFLPLSAQADSITLGGYQTAGNFWGEVYGSIGGSYNEAEKLILFCVDPGTVFYTNTPYPFSTVALSTHPPIHHGETYGTYYQAAWLMNQYGPSVYNVELNKVNGALVGYTPAETGAAVQLAILNLLGLSSTTWFPDTKIQNLASTLLGAVPADSSTLVGLNTYYTIYVTEGAQDFIGQRRPGGEVPIPPTVYLLGAGLLGLVGLRRKFRK